VTAAAVVDAPGAPTTAYSGSAPATPSPTSADPGELRWIVAATFVSLTVATSILVAGAAGREATRLALRATARVSFGYFIMAFTAAPLARVLPGRASAWLLRRRRAFGVAFGASMTVHVFCILRLYALYAPERPPMVTNADFLIGIPGLALVGFLTLTSWVAIRRRVAPLHWRRLHRSGIYVVWTIFFLCLVDSVGRKGTAHPILAYDAFIAVLLGAMALRVRAWRLVDHPRPRR
jgi:hypothetical protein